MKPAKFNLLLTVSICICLLNSSCSKKKDSVTVAPPVKVKVMVVSENKECTITEFSGTVSSSETTTVSFAVPGTITELYGKEGEKVNKGQLLGKLRNGEYLNAYNIAEAQLAEAQDGYQRLKKLHDANALPDVKWVEMQQKLKQAQNAAEMAKRTLDDADLHSPVSGTITRKYVDVGQTVMPVEPAFEIVSTNHLTIEIPVSENKIGSLNIGDVAYVDLESAGVRSQEGKITQKAITADPITRTYTVKVSLPETNGKILPGMIGTVKFENSRSLDSTFNGVTLPSQAVQLNNDNRWFVWVIKDSVAERRFVSADELVSDGVLVNQGLKPGDIVIVEGMQKVGSGSKVVYSL